VIVGDPDTECVEVGAVDGISMSESDLGYESAKNDLREQAAGKGATHVRIEREKKSNVGGYELQGTAFRCPNAPPPAEGS
jgi:hypothetical protein